LPTPQHSGVGEGRAGARWLVNEATVPWRAGVRAQRRKRNERLSRNMNFPANTMIDPERLMPPELDRRNRLVRAA